ncbi:MAG TPA: hypothetical protein V6D27_17065 [Vampirovibrionales bacterium]
MFQIHPRTNNLVKNTYAYFLTSVQSVTAIVAILTQAIAVRVGGVLSLMQVPDPDHSIPKIFVYSKAILLNYSLLRGYLKHE